MGLRWRASSPCCSKAPPSHRRSTSFRSPSRRTTEPQSIPPRWRQRSPIAAANSIGRRNSGLTGRLREQLRADLAGLQPVESLASPFLHFVGNELNVVGPVHGHVG